MPFPGKCDSPTPSRIGAGPVYSFHAFALRISPLPDFAFGPFGSMLVGHGVCSTLLSHPYVTRVTEW